MDETKMNSTMPEEHLREEEEDTEEEEEEEEGHDENQSTAAVSTPTSSIFEAPMTTVTLAADGFGFLRDPTTGDSKGIVRRYTWSNGNKMSAQVISYGATITSIKIPDKNGVPEDIVMGYDNMEGYTSADNPYFGATIGRVTNRIGSSSFTLNGRLYELTANKGKNHIHGGLKGFDKVLWKSHVTGNKVIMTHLSKDGSEGYPGNLMVSVSFELTGDNKFNIDFQATCDKPTPINLTNHSYFNLAGHGAGPLELYNHLVTLNADKFTTVDVESIPTGKFRFVGGTVYDLRVPRGLGGMLKHVSGGGYDLNFCVTKASEQILTFVARALHPESGRVMEVYSDQPGVQFYTGNHLPDPDGKIIPFDYYQDSFALQAVVYDSAICRDELVIEEQYFMPESSSEDQGTFSTYTGTKSSSDKEAKLGQYVPELTPIREGKEAPQESEDEEGEEEESGYEGDEEEAEEEEEEEEEQEPILDEIKIAVIERDSKEKPITNEEITEFLCCEPECLCAFSMECDNTPVLPTPTKTVSPIEATASAKLSIEKNNSPANKSLTSPKDSAKLSPKITPRVLEKISPKTSVKVPEKSSGAGEGAGEGPGDLDIKSSPKSTPEKCNMKRTVSQQTESKQSSKKSQTTSIEIPSELEPVEEMKTSCLHAYKSCEAHFMDVIDMEMPDYGPTTENQPYREVIRGKMGARYRRHGAMCFETQNYPDAVNHSNFPSSILYPGHFYKHKIVYKFGIQAGKDDVKLQGKSPSLVALGM